MSRFIADTCALKLCAYSARSRRRRQTPEKAACFIRNVNTPVHILVLVQPQGYTVMLWFSAFDNNYFTSKLARDSGDVAISTKLW